MGEGAWLRQVEPTDIFAPVDASVRRYITWTALALRSPGRPAVDVLKEYCIGSLSGRYMLVADGQQAGYVGISRGIEQDTASIAYYVLPAARGRHLAARAVRAVTDIEIPGITAWELTIADRNRASVRVAEQCGFLATNQYITDEVLRLREQVYRKPRGIE
jgi:RimJ/RimL family protein N-acetyltransferase